MTIILGGNMSSRLFISVRERRGLCYFIRCFPNYYQDTGNVVIQAGLDKSRIDEAIKVIMQELDRIKKKGVTQKELNDAKAYIRGKTILSLENTSSLAEYYSKQELLSGELLSPDQKFKKIQKVTRADIQTIAKTVFDTNKTNLALIGPFKSKDRFEKLFR